MALNLDLEHKRKRLIVIKDETLSVSDVTNVFVKTYLTHFTYVEKLSPHFHTQLRYCLPQVTMPAPSSTDNGVADYSRDDIAFVELY